MNNTSEFWHGKQVLVTGGAGFIGSHLVEHLVDQGATVRVIDTLRSGQAENLARVADRIQLQDLDVREINWAEWLKEYPNDVIFHFAANAYVPPSVEQPAFDYELNFAATFRLLEALRITHWPGTLVYASSAAVYGNAPRIPISEEDPTVPVSPYGVGKLAAERYVDVFSKLYNLKAASVRLFSAYGPRQRKQVVYDLMEKIRRTPDEIFIHGDGTQVRDFGYVEDMALAAAVVAEHGALQGEVYNVGAGRGCTIRELAEHLCQLMDAQPKLVFSGTVRPGDPEKLVVAINRLESLGYTPRFTLVDGLQRTVDWFNGQRA